MTTDHKAATTTSTIDDIRAVATAFARVAADLCDDAYVRKMAVDLRLGDLNAVERLMPPFRADYRANYKNLPRAMDLSCTAAFAIEAAARAHAEPDAYEARFGVLSARNSCVCVTQRIDFDHVDVNGENGDESRAKVDALAAKYVAADVIASVLS